MYKDGPLVECVAWWLYLTVAAALTLVNYFGNGVHAERSIARATVWPLLIVIELWHMLRGK